MFRREAVGQRPARRRSARREPRRFSPRQAFGWVAISLSVVLIALAVVLVLLLSRPETFVAGGEPVEGIVPVWVAAGPGTGDKPLFDRPMGVALGVQGRIYVTDAGNDRVCVFDRRGRFLFEFGGKGVIKPMPGAEATWEPGLLNYPIGIDVDDDGTVYVADFQNDQIQVFDRDGIWLRSFPDATELVGKGSSGKNGGGIAVTDVAVADGKVYALDTWQVLVFTTDGELLAQFGKPGVEPGDFDHPNGIAVDEDGVIYVADSNNARVQAFDADGEFLWVIGASSTAASGDTTVTPDGGGEFELPRGITLTADGYLVVADAFAHSIVRISWDGRVVGRYGIRGTLPGELNFPNDIYAIGDGFVIADKENGRVQLVRLVRE